MKLAWFWQHKIISAVLALVVLGIIGSAAGTGSSAPAGSASKPAASAPKSPPKPSPTQPSSSAPAPTPAEQLQSAVDDSDADSPKVKMLGSGQAVVEFDVRDNFSDNLIRVGIAKDVFGMAEKIAGADLSLRRVLFRGTFPLTDQYGNEKPGQVFAAWLRVSDMRRINYDNIMVTDYDSLARLAIYPPVLHPDLRG
ncbi:MAG: hypothetical protein ACXVXP_00370 [Mycobacteriaceae bacterium]